MKKISFDKEEKVILAVLIFLCLISFFIDSYIVEGVYIIRNVFLDYILAVFSYNLALFLPLLTMVSVYLYSKNKKEGILPLWVSFVATFVIVYILKFIVQRPRMLGEMYTVFHFADYSFPSAHAALSFAVLAVIDEEFRKLKIVWLAIALLIIFSRLYFSYHYFSDVAFGALIGYGVGMAVTKYFNKK